LYQQQDSSSCWSVVFVVEQMKTERAFGRVGYEFHYKHMQRVQNHAMVRYQTLASETSEHPGEKREQIMH
jgi:hypothetical protein